MSPRLKVIVAMAIGALTVGLKLVTAAPPDEADLGPAFVRMGLVFGVPALAAGLASFAPREEPEHSSLVTTVFLSGVLVVACSLVVSEFLYAAV